MHVISWQRARAVDKLLPIAYHEGSLTLNGLHIPLTPPGQNV